ncbi:MAG: O-methyltransferase [Desulfobacterales bacterium]|nr:O-methyltransferase [Desulfobacterales bacterium]MBF0398734.1 O-methyltransferase [Desulfobacterales bacterium]
MAKMIENIEDYFKGFIPLRNSVFLELEREAKKEEIPIIGPFVGELLNILATIMNAKNILELGTAIGYSTLYLASACANIGGKVTTIEVNPAHVKRAIINSHKAAMQDYVKIIKGDALTVMKSMDEVFDLVFVDIDKEYYLDIIDESHRLLKKYGLLVVDNVGFKDAIEFNKKISTSYNKWKTIQLFSLLPLHSPEKDGLCFAMRI